MILRETLETCAQLIGAAIILGAGAISICIIYLARVIKRFELDGSSS